MLDLDAPCPKGSEIANALIRRFGNDRFQNLLFSGLSTPTFLLATPVMPSVQF
jgi:hypothetical protein